MKKQLMSILIMHFVPFSVYAGWPPGLENCGNTCFLNATLQVLYNIEEMNAILRTNKKLYPVNSVPYYYQELISRFDAASFAEWPHQFGCKDEKGQQTDLDKLASGAYRDIGSACGTQQDASEFLNRFITHNLITKSNKEEIRDLIKGIFFIDLKSMISCPPLKIVEAQFTLEKLEAPRAEIQLYLSLPVLDSKKNTLKTLGSCLNEYFKAERLEKYRDERIEKDRYDCSKQLLMGQSPAILMIALNRFDGTKKLDHTIKIPSSINITNFLVKEKREKATSPYFLTSVIVHSGSLRGGHYWAYVKKLEKGEEGEYWQWYKCNDSAINRVSITDKSVLKEIEGSEGSATGYFFVYQQEGGEKSIKTTVIPPAPVTPPATKPTEISTKPLEEPKKPTEVTPKTPPITKPAEIIPIEVTPKQQPSLLLLKEKLDNLTIKLQRLSEGVQRIKPSMEVIKKG
jgi:ubiquitin C-terminal hydrolase